MADEESVEWERVTDAVDAYHRKVVAALKAERDRWKSNAHAYASEMLDSDYFNEGHEGATITQKLDGVQRLLDAAIAQNAKMRVALAELDRIACLQDYSGHPDDEPEPRPIDHQEVVEICRAAVKDEPIVYALVEAEMDQIFSALQVLDSDLSLAALAMLKRRHKWPIK